MTMGLDPALVAGAILSGAIFGDKMSPLSDSTNLASAVAGFGTFAHIKNMMGQRSQPFDLFNWLFSTRTCQQSSRYDTGQRNDQYFYINISRSIGGLVTDHFDVLFLHGARFQRSRLCLSSLPSTVMIFTA